MAAVNASGHTASAGTSPQLPISGRRKSGKPYVDDGGVGGPPGLSLSALVSSSATTPAFGASRGANARGEVPPAASGSSLALVPAGATGGYLCGVGGGGALSLGPATGIVLPLRRMTDTKALGWMVKPTRHRTFGQWNPRIPDHTVTTVFSYMTNDELYNSSLVCTSWAALTMDGEVWNWEGVDCSNVPLTPAHDATKASPARRGAIEGPLPSPMASPLAPTSRPTLSLESPLRLAPVTPSRGRGRPSKATAEAVPSAAALAVIAGAGVSKAKSRARK